MLGQGALLHSRPSGKRVDFSHWGVSDLNMKLSGASHCLSDAEVAAVKAFLAGGGTVFTAVEAGRCNEFGEPREAWPFADAKGRFVYLPKEGMYADDFEGTVDGAHPNDWGMMHMAAAYGGAVRRALGLARPSAPGKQGESVR